MEGNREPIIRPISEMHDDEFAALHAAHSENMNTATAVAGEPVAAEPIVAVAEQTGPNGTTVQPAVNAPNIPPTPAAPNTRTAKEPNPWRRLAVGALAGVVALGIIDAAVIANKHDKSALSTPNDGSDVTPDQEPTFKKEVKEIFVGFNDDELKIGDDVNFNNNPEERGTNTILHKTLKSQEDIKTTVNGNDEIGQKLHAQLVAAFPNDPENLARALSGEGYVPVQITKAGIVRGNTYMKNGKIYFSNHDRKVAAGDIYWMYTDKDGHINRAASFRADCGNIHLELIVPQPETPTTHGNRTTTTHFITSTTGRNTTTTRFNTTTTVAKNPDLDYNNPGHTGTTSPNQGPGAGGQPGPKGTTSTTSKPNNNGGGSTPNTTGTTIDANQGGPATTQPAGECGEACE